MPDIPGYLLASVAVLLIVAATLVALWPSMEPYEPPAPPWTADTQQLRYTPTLARLRDTGGFVGRVHRDCLAARRDGQRVCAECAPALVARVKGGAA